jgi:curli production assembly/transport component CsgG
MKDASMREKLNEKRRGRVALILIASFLTLLTGCTARLANLATERASITYTSAAHKDLVSLPPLQKKIVVSVYAFRDQTGQYKPLPNATSFSTAVTQGAASMLIQALNDSNSFVPVEREGLQNLLTERKIIRAAAGEMGNGDKEKSVLPPLLSAAILIEGGIIAYDTNVVTGGLGAKYFGLGGSIDYRVDQVSLYLRAVDVKSGRILKTVSTTKTILSRGVDVQLFRFVSLQRLLEVETGLTTNEPPQLCVMEALEKAVTGLVIEGILDRLWALKNPEDMNSPVIRSYLKERGVPPPRLDGQGNPVGSPGRSHSEALTERREP